MNRAEDCSETKPCRLCMDRLEHPERYCGECASPICRASHPTFKGTTCELYADHEGSHLSGACMWVRAAVIAPPALDAGQCPTCATAPASDLTETLRAIAQMDDREVAESDSGSYARDLARQALKRAGMSIEDPVSVLTAVWEHWQGGDVPPELERRILAVLRK